MIEKKTLKKSLYDFVSSFFAFRKKYKIKVGSKNVVFNVERPEIRKWFYPRYLFEIHEPNVTKYVVKKGRHLKRFIDIGANLGWFSCIASASGYESVISFEPSEKNYSILNKNINLNEKRVRSYRIAVSNKREDTRIESGQFDPEAKLKEGKCNSNTSIVESVCLEDISKFINSKTLIKIDTEGSEYEILKGGKNVIKKEKPYLAIELHPFISDRKYEYMLSVLSVYSELYIFEEKKVYQKTIDELYEKELKESAFNLICEP